MTNNDTVIKGFPRKEVMELCGVPSGRLSYLDRTGLIVPSKIGNKKAPIVLYSWFQVLEIRAINTLRERVSLQTVRKILDLFNDRTLSNKRLVVLGDEVFEFKPELLADYAVQLTGKNPNQITMLMMVDPLESYTKEIVENAKKSKIIDFNSFKERAMIA